MNTQHYTAEELIKKIIEAPETNWEVVFNDAATFDSHYKDALMLIHPDKCSVPEAATAASKLNVWRDFNSDGKEYKDDIGPFRTNNYFVRFETKGHPSLSWSRQNLEQFWNLANSGDKAAQNFKRYMPEYVELTKDGLLQMDMERRSIPLSGLTLAQEHVNWVLNRLLEYCAFLAQIDMVHCGLTPESVFISPENHGIQVVSFYHMARVGKKVGTISAKYSHWYPAALFQHKTASSVIDLEMVKKIAVYLLGEPSGNAAKLRKTHNEHFINFLLTNHTTAYSCLMEYKELLAKHWEKKFHILNI